MCMLVFKEIGLYDICYAFTEDERADIFILFINISGKEFPRGNRSRSFLSPLEFLLVDQKDGGVCFSSIVEWSG